MQPERRKKVEALLGSPIAGEREAAQAALGRMAVEPALPTERPVYGTAEWHAAIQAWGARLQFCDSQRGSPLLSPAEVTLVRNWARGRGTPWDADADAIERIYQKLMAAENERLRGQKTSAHHS